MKDAYWALPLLFSVLLQATVMNLLSVGSIKPSLPLLVLVYLAPRKSVIASVALAFFTGLVADLSVGSPLGL